MLVAYQHDCPSLSEDNVTRHHDSMLRLQSCFHLVYFHRVIEVTVKDKHGVIVPAGNVKVTFVGTNDHSPNVTLSSIFFSLSFLHHSTCLSFLAGLVYFTEGDVGLSSVISGNLRITDIDHS